MAEYLIQDTTLTEIANAIRTKTGGTDPIPVPDMAVQISGITAGGGTGGSSEDVRYVTFLSEDGTVEYGKKPVAVGDDCADPIVRGIFATPTKESDVQYNYTFAGWASTPGGGVDPDALKAVVQDRMVYANFAAVIRLYTITYYDGNTVLKTEQLAYGATPSYHATKEGFNFTGWEPALVPVTGDASYSATWVEKVGLDALSWARIAEIAESGQASSILEIGQTKTFETTKGISVTVEIVGFDHDNLADGTGKAGITMKMSCSCSESGVLEAYYGSKVGASYHNTTSGEVYWGTSNLRTVWNNLDNGYGFEVDLPADLLSVIKTVTKKYYTQSGDLTSDDTFWLPALSELGFSGVNNEGECYAAYTPGKAYYTDYPELVMKSYNKTVSYLCRSKFNPYAAYCNVITAAGRQANGNMGYSSYATFPFFCI